MNQIPDFDARSLYKGIFGNPRGRGAAVPRRAPAADTASPEPGPEPLDSGGEAAGAQEGKPKVILRNLAWSVSQGSFNKTAKYHLEADLPSSLAHLTRLEVKIIVLTPDGKESVDRKEIHIKEGKATGEATLYYPQYREDGNLPASCDFIFTAKHRDSEEAESPKLPVKQPFVSNLRWEKVEEWFGVPVKLLANTCLKDGEEVSVKVASENGVALETKAKAKKGKLEIPWTPCLCGVGLDGEGKYPEKVEYYAEVSKGEERTVPDKNFFLKVVGKTEYHTFSKDYTWGIYGVHAEFKQRIEKGAVDVQVEKTIIKAWQGFLVDMTRAGIAGVVAGCPHDKKRWGRIVGIGDVPNQYFDGAKWLAMPKGFVPKDDEFSAFGFIKSGDKFAEGGESNSTWPDKFKDYDFEKAAYIKKRNAWKKDTDGRWSGKFLIRPNVCSKGLSTGGCGYPLDLNLEMRKVESWQEHTIAVCRGNFRSNAGCFSLEDPDIAMVAHEVGHLVGMPDEYVDGAVDPTINGDGAVNGIDATTIMGQNMDKVKKRHYSNFSTVVGAQVGNKVGKKMVFLPADE